MWTRRIIWATAAAGAIITVIATLTTIRPSSSSSHLSSFTSYLTYGATTAGAVAAVAAAVGTYFSSRGRSQYRSRIDEIVKVGVDSPEAIGQAVNPDELLLARYIVDRDAAERRLAAYLPANPRRAKRLLNHERLYRQIAESRNIFGGDPALTYDHITRWSLIVEEWPRLGAALTSDPAIARGLETAADIAVLQQKLDKLVPSVKATDELFTILCGTGNVRLSPVLARLVRFEPAPAAPAAPPAAAAVP